MKMNDPEPDVDGSLNDVERYEVEAELVRILRDAEFRRNAAAAQFLRFVVEETLEGRGDRLKAFTIATSVLGRGSDFDPQANSVVRVQAKRLRELLEHYYKAAGAQNPIQIVLPVGSYQPQFQRIAPVEAPRARPDAAARAVALDAGRRFAPRDILLLVIALIIGSAVFSSDISRLLGLPLGATASGTRVPGLPIVVVQTDPPSASPNADEQAGLVAASLESALTHYDFILVHSYADTARQNDADYQLLVRAGASNGSKRDFVFRLLSARSREIIWSRAVQAVDVDGQGTAFDSMVNLVAANVGDLAGGAIMADVRRRNGASLPRSLEGDTCVLSAIDTIVRYTYNLSRSIACLEAEVARSPDDPRLMALLSALLVSEYLDAPPGPDPAATIARARQLGERAAARAPQLGIALLSLFASRFFGGDIEGAFELAPQILHPSAVSSLSQSLLAAAYILRGRYDDGAALGAQIQARSFQQTAFMPSSTALAAYMRGDDVTARRIIFRPEASPIALTFLLRAALCASGRDQDCVRNATDQLARNFPGVAGDVAGALDRYQVTDKIKSKLLGDLRAARQISDALR
ncbi:hypothetical protein DB459_15250 [Bradyrhizobium sp. WD16]|nr:hypothetical protein DB459_15250 [Bradyrhizobium sp. WD16]